MIDFKRLKKRKDFIKKVIDTEIPIKAACVLETLGYKCVSRKHRTLSRIDDPNWYKKHKYLKKLGLDCGSAQDQYRRCHSLDKITVSQEVCVHVSSSGGNNTGYVDIDSTIRAYEEHLYI
jgi:hypothetical protein